MPVSSSAEPRAAARVDAVVVSYNSRDTLRACVAPLAAQPGVAVTVVDNDSPDRSLEVIADLPARAIQSGRNAGFGAGCNLGMAAGTAPLVLFLNPDAQLAPEELERLVAVLDAEPDVALVGPRMLDADGALIPSQRRWQRAGSAWAQALFLHRLLPRATWANEIQHAPADYDAVGYPEWLSGTCMLARREALEAIGGFDEGYFLYCEDMDLCARLCGRGPPRALRAGRDRPPRRRPLGAAQLACSACSCRAGCVTRASTAAAARRCCSGRRSSSGRSRTW